MATEADRKATYGQQARQSRARWYREGIWKQREETVFQINDQFRRFWLRGDYNLGFQNGNGDEIAYFVPIMFDKANRTFNWVAAANPILEAATLSHESSSSAKYAQDALQKVLKALFGAFFKLGDELKNLQWQKFEGRYDDQPGAFIKEYLEVIHKAAEKYGRQSEGPECSESLLSKGEFERLSTAMLMAYSCYSHPSDQNFEGIFFRILEEVGHTHPDIVADAVFGIADDGVLDLTAWKNARGSSFPECPFQDCDGRRRMKEPDKGGLRYSNSRIEEANVLQSAFLYPLLMDWDSGEGKPLKGIIESHNFRVLVPIYDVWSGTQGWGGLKAVLLIFLKPPEQGFENNADPGKGKIGNPAWEPNFKKMLERCSEFAQEIGQAATRRALSRPIVPPYDLVRQFLRILIEVQDWEEAAVFYNNDKYPHYSFKRVPHDNPDKEYKGVRKGWKEKEWKESGADQQSRQPSNELIECNEFYMWWTSENDKSCQDLWSQAVLPGLSDEERAEAGGISIRFKFPKACRIPPDPKTRQFLVEAYRRQQVELMRGLIPKVRARRAALRNAVSAIMARNMSHNIGSHVLARYASTISKDGPPTQEGQQAPPPNVQPIDPRTDFLIYLQKRMDFLAEFGTSDKAFWTQPLVLKTQLDQLSLDVQIGRLAIQRGAKRQAAMSPMLAYISGKNAMTANVTFVGNEKLLFSCPGGEVGVHALYIVLENIIRNSARHNVGRAETGQVEIHVHARIGSDASSQGALFPSVNWPGLIEFRILDVGSELGPGGRRQSEPGEKKWDYKNGEQLRQMFEDWRIAEGNEDGKTPDKFLESLSIPDRLNWIIQNERIINDDGRPSPKFLGIREIQICAQYLREFFLSDLEDVPYSERDNAANKVPLIRAECFDRGKGKYCLSYVLYIQEVKLLEILRAEPEESKIAGALANLRNHVFVAYDGSEAAITNWVEKFKGDLPVRRLNTVPQGLDELESQKQIEALYEIYAQQIQGGGGAVLAGLALMANGAANQSSARPVCLAPAEQEAWQDWLSAQASGGQKLDACVWVDHPTETKLKQLEHWASEAGNDTIRSISVELIYSDSPAITIIRSLQPGEGWELIAAALPRVVVLDERVQTEAKKDIRDFKAERYWQLMHVHVPDRETEVDLDYPKFGQCRKYLETFTSKVDYLVLHLSILESLAQQQKGSGGGENIFSTIDALTHGTRSKTAQVVIVTGRGVQTFDRSQGRVQREVRYLPVSALLEYLVHRPSKLGLMRVIWCALPLIVRETDA
jgi:hypothetical protein